MYFDIPRYLYHGTSAANYERIRERGYLAPRSMSKATGNWKHTIQSNRDAIYMTTAYPLHFALSATDDRSGAVIIEIDTSLLQPSLFVADEDAIEQHQRGKDTLPATMSMKQRTMWYRKRIHKYNPTASLSLLGTCGYKGPIYTHEFSRAAHLSHDAVMELVMYAGMDPSITVMHYQLLGEMYEENVRWLFGDTAYMSVRRSFDQLDNTRDVGPPEPTRPSGIRIEELFACCSAEQRALVIACEAQQRAARSAERSAEREQSAA